MSSSLLKSRRKKTTLYKKYIKNQKIQNKQIFILYIKKCKVVRRESESRYYAERISMCTENLTNTWKIIKQRLHSKNDPGISGTFVIGGDKSNNPLLIEHTFNDYFTSVGPSLANNIPRFTCDLKHVTPHVVLIKAWCRLLGRI